MLALDHVIWVSEDIDAMSQAMDRKLGVKTVQGGQHTHWGTYNYLTHLANNAYIEWLGVNDISIARNTDNPLIAHTLFALEEKVSHPIQFALRTNEMDNYLEHFKRENIPFVGPVQGRRQKPDGKVLTWRMLFPKYDYQVGEVLPFLIEWDQAENERIDQTDINDTQMTDIFFDGVSIERFQKIYQIDKQSQSNILELSNSKLHFDEKTRLEVTFK